MQILGLITARGGSKSIPQKNLVSLAGKPLLAYTCDTALASRVLTRVVLDTDDIQIARMGRDLGVEVPYMRPAHLALDDTPHLAVVQHALDWLSQNEGYVPAVLAILQPTSPLRRPEHIDEALRLLLEKNADTVVSVVEVPHNLGPQSLMRMDEDGFLCPLAEGPLLLRRQAKLRLYARNGPAVLAMRREVITQGTLYGPRVCPYLMDKADSVDIDTYDDLALAGFYLDRRKSPRS